jgi:integrase
VTRHAFGSQMAMAGADPFAIMKAMGHTDIKTTMIYVSFGKSHIRDQVEKLNGISIPKNAYTPSHVTTRSSQEDAFQAT